MWKQNKQKKHFSHWIDEHHSALYRHALWMTGNADVAKDLVQETYYQAWVSIHTLKDNAAVLGWLLTILRRCNYREYRAQVRQEAISEQLDIITSDNAELTQYQAIDLQKAINSLSDNHREILLLHSLHGFSYQEISAQLCIPPGTVMSRLSRAKEQVKKQLVN